ncbi:MAG: hypothetical protein HKM02_05700, partial [Pseudomonadales bacterium]|nr:hypothetical protein [Pseudomonadales bacterium]
MRTSNFFKKMYRFAVDGMGGRRSQEFDQIGSDDQPPLRAELLSAGQMQLHGKRLACAHVLGQCGVHDLLLRRLDDNERVLMGTCSLLTQAVRANLPIAPAGEWLLDNLYL